MSAGLLEAEGVRDRGERKGAVDHRVAMDGVDAADQVHLMTAAADDQALKVLLPGHEHGRQHCARPPGQYADQRDVAADACGLIDCASVNGRPTSTT